MRRSLLILVSVVIAGLAAIGSSYLIARQICAHHWVDTSDDLEWLRHEFQLGDAELQRVRQLHEGYLPKCRVMCERIAAKKLELEAAFDTSTNAVTPVVAEKLNEVAALRAQCQAQMLQHFYEVSQSMPAAQGRRYLEEMQRLTLGFHEQVENRMSGQPSPAHVHH